MPAFDPKRLEALVLYIAHKTADDSYFGRIKLAKVLFYSDFQAYRDEGDALTGATYMRMPRGPIPRDLDVAEASLKRRGLVRLDHDVGEYEEKRIIPLGPAPDFTGHFEGWQLLLVDHWIVVISAKTAGTVSEESHEYLGWLLAGETGVIIPYESVYAPYRLPPDEAVELGERLEREHQWT